MVIIDSRMTHSSATIYPVISYTNQIPNYKPGPNPDPNPKPKPKPNLKLYAILNLTFTLYSDEIKP